MTRAALLSLLLALPALAAPPTGHAAISDEPAPVVAPEPAPASKTSLRILRIAVTDLELGGVDARAGRVITDALLAELRKLQRASVIGFDEVRAMLDLEAERAAMGCDEESSCLAEIADALGADALIIGSVSKVGDEVLLALKRIDQSQAKAAQTVTERLPAADPVELLLAIGPAVEKLFPEVPLQEGQSRGVSEVMHRQIDPPPLPAWAFYGALSGASALLVGAAVAGGLHLLSAAELRSLGELSQVEVVDGKEVVAAQRSMVAAEVTGWTLAGTAVVAAGVAGGAALLGLIDFEGYGQENAE